jgi:hypothetical protein
MDRMVSTKNGNHTGWRYGRIRGEHNGWITSCRGAGYAMGCTFQNALLLSLL